jgi:hypothetical protein
MSKVVKKLYEILSHAPVFGAASPEGRVVYETADIALGDVWKLYERDSTCKSSVDLLAASAVGMGFYTTVDEKYAKAEKAKDVVDEFCENVNLDGLLNDMARRLIACGNDFWLKLTPDRLSDVVRLPVGAVDKVALEYIERLRVPWRAKGYVLKSAYCEGTGRGDADRTLKPEAVIHWRLNNTYSGGLGTGLLQVLLHTLTIGKDKRPAYAWMKAKIELIMTKIFEKYAGPDVLAVLENAKGEVIQKFENTIKNRPEEGAWLFYGGKGAKGEIHPVTIDPRARFEHYIDHIVNQFYLGVETPLPRLFSTPGFTEASARAALELQSMLIKPIQRYIKRQVERDLFDVVVKQAGLNVVAAGIRLNFGSPESPEVNVGDMLKAKELGLISKEEFRKNAVKWGWELSEEQQPKDSKSNDVNKRR